MALEGVNEHIDPFEYNNNTSNNNSRFAGGPNGARRESDNEIFYSRNSKDEISTNTVS